MLLLLLPPPLLLLLLLLLCVCVHVLAFKDKANTGRRSRPVTMPHGTNLVGAPAGKVNVPVVELQINVADGVGKVHTKHGALDMDKHATAIALSSSKDQKKKLRARARARVCVCVCAVIHTGQPARVQPLQVVEGQRTGQCSNGHLK